jgi:hypothetical protein
MSNFKNAWHEVRKNYSLYIRVKMTVYSGTVKNDGIKI